MSAKIKPKITKILCLTLINIFSNPAGKHYRLNIGQIIWQIGQEQCRHFIHHHTAQRIDQSTCHASSNLIHCFSRNGLAKLKIMTGSFGMKPTRRIQPHDLAIINGNQPPANIQRRRPDNFPAIQQCQFGRATADINIQNTVFLIMAGLGCTRSKGGQHCLHMVTSGCGNKLTALFRNNLGDRRRIITA